MAKRKVYPRVGGGNTTDPMMVASSRGLSPRGRGKRGGKATPSTWTGSIPAWAGETGRRRPRL